MHLVHAVENMGQAPRARLHAIVFGEFRLETSEGAVLSLHNRRAALILAILCLQPSYSMEREALARLLWPDRFIAQAKASLRQCLHDLRRQLHQCGFTGFKVERSDVALDGDAITCDLWDFDAALNSDKNELSISYFMAVGNQPLLQGMSLNPVFEEWLNARREHIDARLKVAVAEALAGCANPAREQLLDAARIRFPDFRTFPHTQNCVPVAVLPFSQIDEVGGNFFLAEAVTDELTSQLGKVASIAVSGRTSVESIAAKGGTLREMAKDLRVSHLVEGGVRRSPDRIAVWIALIDGASGTELWSDRIEGSIDDFFESRKIIGANVIAAICGVLGLAQTTAPARRMTANREAYTLFLQGCSMIQRSIQDGVAAKAVELLERSLAIDPDFAECWTALADAHIYNAVYTPCLDRVERSEKAAECARRAIELDPAQGQALAIQGIHEWTKKNPAGALDLAFEAYARQPESADVASRLGSFLLYIGRSRDALPIVEASVEQDPVSARNYAMLLAAHFNLGNIEQALVAGQRMVDLGMPGMWLATVQAAQGDHEAATATYYASRMLMNTVILPPVGTQPMAPEARDAYWNIAAKGCCSGKAEDRALYCQMLGGLHATMPDPHDPSIAFPAIWMGHSELAMKIYRERIHPANMFGLMSLWADSDPIRRTREHPGFMAFAEDIGLVEAWERYGWPDVMPNDPRNT